MKNVLQKKSVCKHVLVAFDVELTHRWGKAGCDVCGKRTLAGDVARAPLSGAPWMLMTVDLTFMEWGMAN